MQPASPLPVRRKEGRGGSPLVLSATLALSILGGSQQLTAVAATASLLLLVLQLRWRGLAVFAGAAAVALGLRAVAPARLELVSLSTAVNGVVDAAGIGRVPAVGREADVRLVRVARRRACAALCGCADARPRGGRAGPRWRNARVPLALGILGILWAAGLPPVRPAGSITGGARAAARCAGDRRPGHRQAGIPPVAVARRRAHGSDRADCAARDAPAQGLPRPRGRHAGGADPAALAAHVCGSCSPAPCVPGVLAVDLARHDYSSRTRTSRRPTGIRSSSRPRPRASCCSVAPRGADALCLARERLHAQAAAFLAQPQLQQLPARHGGPRAMAWRTSPATTPCSCSRITTPCRRRMAASRPTAISSGSIARRPTCCASWACATTWQPRSSCRQGCRSCCAARTQSSCETTRPCRSRASAPGARIQPASSCASPTASVQRRPGRPCRAGRPRVPGWSVQAWTAAQRQRAAQDGLFRAVEHPAGSHRVEWRFQPRSVRLGFRDLAGDARRRGRLRDRHAAQALSVMRQRWAQEALGVERRRRAGSTESATTRPLAASVASSLRMRSTPPGAGKPASGVRLGSSASGPCRACT